MDFYSVEGKDLEGIVSQLRLTAGVEVAIFIYEMQTQLFKVSLRSNGKVDVSKIAVFFGGGGHVRAAGCDMQGSMYDVINNLTAEIENSLQRSKDKIMDGILVIRKEKGYTSHDVVAKLRGILHMKRSAIPGLWIRQQREYFLLHWARGPGWWNFLQKKKKHMRRF